MFMERCQASDKLERLAFLTTWREPWHGAPSLGLRPRLDIGNAMHMAAELCDMPRLRSLPPEIAEIVRSFSESALFWRYVSVSELVDRASKTFDDKKEIASRPILRLRSWKRGSLPVGRSRSLPATTKPAYRITMDSCGICSIDRISEPLPSPPSSYHSDSFAYIVETEATLRGITLDFAHGLCRLVLNGIKKYEMCIWDRPCPPNVANCLLSSEEFFSSYASFRQMRTINPRECTGITFFIGYETFAIHGHSPAYPTAEQTFLQIPPTQQETALWVYVPLSSRDHVEAFGIQEMLHGVVRPYIALRYLFRTALCGDVSLGPYYRKSLPRIRSRVTTDGLALAYNAFDSTVYHVGVESGNHDEVQLTASTPISQGPSEISCFSSAPLADVVSVEIFEHPVTGLFRGLIFSYANGSERALGECRIGVDPSCICKEPVQICIASLKYQLPDAAAQFSRVKVEASHESHDSEQTHCMQDLVAGGPSGSVHDVSWQCVPMKGLFECWSQLSDTWLNHVDGG
ncbi:hypothetical protein F66182_1163 [Fusarium sp. NRRL 66182]|nr:hypothetical protein F66182_1163 [Fusarium sp. NRRL 66182]